MTEEHTMEARLCDDRGQVSHEPHPKFEGTYIGFLNHLRSLSGHEPYDGEKFTCTGNAHLAHEHIRCTSPWHDTPRIETIEGVNVEYLTWTRDQILHLQRRLDELERRPTWPLE